MNPRIWTAPLGITMALALIGACSKKPPKAAKASLVKFLDAQKARNLADLKAQIVPDQREKVTFDKSVALGNKSGKTWPVLRILGMQFFEFDSYKISKETLDSKTQATYLVTFSYKDGAVSALSAIMTKTGEGWKFDVKKTVLFAKKLDGAHAFSAVKLKKK
ncbi:MAG: hypothetical protein J7M25_05500 [Deltaproteobacteria bacterium]|nr:hypothetical protein [Deltaproteobacteria bacterium]